MNGEAIRGTRPWTRAESTTACGVPVRFTRKADALYALLLGTPAGVEVHIHGVRTTAGSEVRLLGRDEHLTWRQGDEGVIPDQPAHAFEVNPEHGWR